MILINVNQQALQLPLGATVADALAEVQAQPPYAVALNGEFLPRSLYTQQPLQANDQLELVEPMQGG